MSARDPWVERLERQDRGEYARPGHVDVLNQSWPPLDVARVLHDRPRDEWIAVRVRLDFEGTGPEWIDGLACRWWGQHVRVNVDDYRVVTYGAWIHASDVRRR